MAVLIDADNVHQDGIREVFLELEPKWNATVRRAYGRNLIKMANAFREMGILPVEVIPNSPGKNAADVALVIDAVFEINAGRVDAFGFVSGDGDLTRLVIAARERGFPVVVFGGPSSPNSLRSAGTEFHLLRSRSSAVSKSWKSTRHANQISPVPTVGNKSLDDFIELVRELTRASGRTTMHRINQHACATYTNFSPRSYGASGLKKLLERLGGFELKPIRNESGQIQDYEVRSR